MSSRTRRSSAWRAMQIAWSIAAFGAWVGWHRGLLRCDGRAVAERFADVLQRLGTTFIKLGQHLSLRADLLPEEAQRALAGLQSHAAPFPAAQAVSEVEAAFGRRWQELFAHFDLEPLAAASVAQIHRATLTDGLDVIVKIRRPGAAELADADMRVLRTVVRTVQWFVPALRPWGLVAVIDEIGANLRLEMDLAREARFVRRFADAWRGSVDIDIPDVVDGLFTPTVMVQRFSRGSQLHALAPEAREAAARKLVDGYAVQIFRHGLFHGDPHPGNLFVMADGRICLHDFGIVGRVDPRMRRALAAFALAFVDQDAEWMVDAWLDLGLVGERARREAFGPVVRSLIADCAERPLSDWSLSGALGRLAAAGRSQDLRLPLDLLVLTRALLLLEGTVRSLAPEFSIFETVSRQAAAGVLDEAPQSPASRRLPYELGSAAADLPALFARSLHDALRRRRMLEIPIVPDARLLDSINRAGRQVALALVTLGLYIASSLLMQHGVGPRWGELPILALAGYVLAIRLTLTIARG